MQNDFQMTPGVSIPRANFNRSSNDKTTLDFDYIYPVYWDEVYPNDTFNMNATVFGRLATPLYPIMDNAYLDMHFFFVPMRILWDNARKFWGEQTDPGDSIAYTIPSKPAPLITPIMHQASVYCHFFFVSNRS